MNEPETIAEMRAKFGDEQTDSYLKLISATRSLTYVWDAYVQAPVGSAQEAVLGSAMSQMMDGFNRHPHKAHEMIESLLALIQHLRWGGKIDDWFESLGVSATPGAGDL